MFSESAYIEACATQLAQSQLDLRSERERAEALKSALIRFRNWLDERHMYAATTELNRIINDQ